TLTALIEEGLRAVVAEKPAGGAPKRRMPPISRAKGGFRVDISNTASLVEEEDRLLLQRWKRAE
ncbi:MAG: hypothetical protein WD076_08850, partial [Parvularculaceae bacterium]